MILNENPDAAIATDRLELTPLAPADLQAFHALVTDPHVRRYLMDGLVLPIEWAEERIRENAGSFRDRGVGLWLVRLRSTGEPIGFCGFTQLAGTGLELELVYALRESFTGQGLATELGLASIELARRAGHAEVSASVDAVNAASVRILEKLGFERVETKTGAFGDLLVLRLELRSRAR